ncbi:hypothetical protein [Hafnia phage yong2]|nr:hypothetical protein [Hafnia phage yong2]
MIADSIPEKLTYISNVQCTGKGMQIQGLIQAVCMKGFQNNC